MSNSWTFKYYSRTKIVIPPHLMTAVLEMIVWMCILRIFAASYVSVMVPRGQAVSATSTFTRNNKIYSQTFNRIFHKVFIVTNSSK